MALWSRTSCLSGSFEMADSASCKLRLHVDHRCSVDLMMFTAYILQEIRPAGRSVERLSHHNTAKDYPPQQGFIIQAAIAMDSRPLLTRGSSGYQEYFTLIGTWSSGNNDRYIITMHPRWAEQHLQATLLTTRSTSTLSFGHSRADSTAPENIVLSWHAAGDRIVKTYGFVWQPSPDKPNTGFYVHKPRVYVGP